MRQDYYRILGVPPYASQEAIDDAFRRLAEKYHPAAETGKPDPGMIDVIEAWKVLSDSRQRERYDTARRGRRRRVRRLPTNRQASETVSRPPRIRSNRILPVRAWNFLLGEIDIHWKSFLWAAILIDVLLVAAFTLLNDTGQFIWIIGITVGTLVAIVTLSRAIASGRAALFGLSSFIAGAVIASIAFLLFFRASAVLPKAPDALVNIASAAGVVALPPVPAVLPEPAGQEAPAAPTARPSCSGGCKEQLAGCIVKGSLGADGEKLFYSPSNPAYDEITLNSAAGDRWFCSESEARASGWKASGRVRAITSSASTTAAAFAVNPMTPNTVYVCAVGANVRSGPGTGYDVLRTQDPNSSIKIAGRSGEWYYAGQVEGRDGFVHQSVVCSNPFWTNKPTPPQATVPIARAQVAGLASYKYGPPTLVNPGPSANYSCKRDLVLQWVLPAGVGGLQADEWFVVESQSIEHNLGWMGITEWTKDTTTVLGTKRGSDGCSAPWWPGPGDYEWRVRIVQGDRATHTVWQWRGAPSAPNEIRFAVN